MGGSSKYGPEFRQRAVRLLPEQQQEYPSEYEAMRSIAAKLGIGSAETLRKWVRRAEVDAGARPGLSTAEQELRTSRDGSVPRWVRLRSTPTGSRGPDGAAGRVVVVVLSSVLLLKLAGGEDREGLPAADQGQRGGGPATGGGGPTGGRDGPGTGSDGQPPGHPAADRCGILSQVERRQSPLDRSTPTLTLFCGLPGSGKSTLAKRLEADGRGVGVSTDEWQAALGVEPRVTDFHERLQVVLYRHALALLRQGVDVILEDGLWMTDERTEKFADARSCSARIQLHVFDVAYEMLWQRLRHRNNQAESADYPMTKDELRSAWSIFQPPAIWELSKVDAYTVHTGGLDHS